MKITFPTPALISAVLKVMTMHASLDTTRPHLSSVFVRILEGERVDVVATDGHRLAIWRFERGEVAVEGGVNACVLIPRHVVLAWLKLAGRDKNGEHVLEVDGKTATFRAFGPERALGFTPEDATFPPYLEVIPKTIEPHTQTLNPNFVGEACGAFMLLIDALDLRLSRGKRGEYPSIGIYGSGDLSPVYLRAHALPSFGVVIMPVKGPDYGTEIEPVGVKFALAEEKQAVPPAKKRAT